MAKKRSVCERMNALDWIAFILVVVGGLNWGLVAFDFNLVSMLLGTGTAAKIVYALVGLSAVYAFFKVITKKA